MWRDRLQRVDGWRHIGEEGMDVWHGRATCVVDWLTFPGIEVHDQEPRNTEFKQVTDQWFSDGLSCFCFSASLAMYFPNLAG